ncbi:hypothetical protein AGLY_001879 [Aphis glycines]|uniref:Uncharacterized protein n=1 Tax=Aphis glycines TaxID=307491 RepID=A0A6G0U452_APHGL|nr:hypothetical protein AGLY_001879 [Aphis glycines]
MKIGHTNISHVHLMRRESRPNCEFCNNAPISTAHLLLECSNLSEQRKIFPHLTLRDILNSERSDECIDSTMMYVFFFVCVSVYSITIRNNASISNFGSGLRWKSEYPRCIIKFSKNREKQKKNDGKMRIFTQNQFSTESIFLYSCNSKTNHCKYLKFSPNVYVSIIYIHVDKIFLTLSKYLKIVYKVPHMPLKHKPPFSLTTGNYILD